MFEVDQELALKSGLKSHKIIYCVPMKGEITIGRKSSNKICVPHKLH